MTWRSIVMLAGGLFLALILGACGSDPARTPVQGDLLYEETFDASGAWEEGVFAADNAEVSQSTLAVREGRYQIAYAAGRGPSFIWGAADADQPTARDVIIDVTTEQLSTPKNNLYGVMCRLSETASGMRGYAFLISGDGYYGIAELQGRDLEFLLEWHQSGAINEGQAANTLQAVCVGEYLALYANGEFLGEVTDAEYGAEGAVALVAGAGANQIVEVAFDDLTVYAGALED